MSIVLQGDRTIGSVVTTLRTCDDLKFLLIQDKISSVVQIFVYSPSKVLEAAEKKEESYTLSITYSIDFKPYETSLENNSCQPVRIEYPYKTQAFVITLVNPTRVYVIIPNITYSDHNFGKCHVQDEDDGTRLALCQQTYKKQLVLAIPSLLKSYLTIAAVEANLIRPENPSFSYFRDYIRTCYLYNDCYGCRLVQATNYHCSWDGEKCSAFGSRKPVEECISFPNIKGGIDMLEVHVKGVRLTNTHMDIAIFTPEDEKIAPKTVEDFKAIFQVDQTLLEDYLAGDVNFTFQINNTFLENSLVRVNLSETTDVPESNLAILVVLILLGLFVIIAVTFFILSRRKTTRDNQGKDKSQNVR